MARSEIPTLLPIDSWAAQMQLNPWEINQVGTGFPVVNNAQCPNAWTQYGWQQPNFVSRTEIAQAIADAETALADELGYWPAPKYTVNESHPYPQNRVVGNMAITPHGLWKAVSLNWGKIIGAGIMQRTLIAAGVVVTQSDTDTDLVPDIFTSAATPTTVTNEDEIAVYFSLADRNNEAVSESWRIRPVKVTISGANVVVTGHPSLLVKPDLTLIVNPIVLDVTVATNFVTTVDIYRVYLDTTYSTVNPAQGIVEWEQSGCGTVPCAVDWLPVCLTARDVDQGMVGIDFWLSGTQLPPRNCEPDRVKVNYLSGYPTVGGGMDNQMASMVAKLATALLPTGACACDRSSAIISYWRSIPTNKDTNLITIKDMDECPFGVTRGALWAWHRIRNKRNVEAVSL